MNIKPILFSAPMVQAIIEGRKTMTRRVVKARVNSGPCDISKCVRYEIDVNKDGECVNFFNSSGFYAGASQLKYRPGDILWVRETFQKVLIEEDEPDDVYGYVYKASPETFEDYGIMRNGKEYPLTWRPSIFMPRVAARIFLRVTNVRAERVQDITVDDVIREGVKDVDNEIRNQDQTTHESIRNWNLAWAKYQFQTLWDSLNAKRGFGWDINPYVWVISFDRISREEVNA